MIKAGNVGYLVKNETIANILLDADIIASVPMGVGGRSKAMHVWRAGYVAGLRDAMAIIKGKAPAPLFSGTSAKDTTK